MTVTSLVLHTGHVRQGALCISSFYSLWVIFIFLNSNVLCSSNMGFALLPLVWFWNWHAYYCSKEAKMKHRINRFKERVVFPASAIMQHLSREPQLWVDDAFPSQQGVRNSWCYFTSVLYMKACESSWRKKKAMIKVLLEHAAIWMKDWNSFISDNTDWSLKSTSLLLTSFKLFLENISKVL